MKKTIILKKLILGSALLLTLSNCGSEDKKKKPKTEEINPAPAPAPISEPKEEVVDDTEFTTPAKKPTPNSGNSMFKFAPMFRYCVEFDGRPWYVCTRLSDVDKRRKIGFIKKSNAPEVVGKLFFRKFKGISEEKSRSCVWWYALMNTKPTICSLHTQ